MFLSAIPLGMLSLTMVLCVQEWTGTLRTAGWISGLFGVGNALGLSVQGPLMDRVGSRPVVATSGGICTAALLSFAAAGTVGSPLWVVAVLAGVAGASVPAITTAVRAWLAFTPADETFRDASYALLSALFQTAVTLGPVLVSLALLVHGPALAIGVAALMVLTATVLFSRTSERHARHTRPHARRHARALSRGLQTLLVAAGLEGLAAGMTAVAIPGVMTDLGVAALVGIAFAALALGEVLGALIFGSRTWPGQHHAQLPLVQCAATLLAVLVYLASPQPWLLVLVMFVAGTAGAPSSVLKSALLDVVTGEAAIARSYSILVAVGLVAAAAGNALAGQLAEPVGVHKVLLFSALALGLATVWTAFRHRTLGTGAAGATPVDA